MDSTVSPKPSCCIAAPTPYAVHLDRFCLSRSGSTRGVTRYVLFHRLKLVTDKKNARIAFFLFLNFAMIAPMVHLFYQHGYDKASKFIGQLLSSASWNEG
jgi:hypothetical protein